MSSFLSVNLNPKLPILIRRPAIPLSATPRPFPSQHSHFKTLLCRASSDHESSLWLREEQRWLREEKRWLKEEQRWDRERDSLLREISDLKLQIQALERQISSQMSAASAMLSPDAIEHVSILLQVLKEKNNLVLEGGSSLKPIESVIGDEREGEKEPVEKGVVIEEKEEVVRVLERNDWKQRSALRIGSEGNDVRDMQEALLKLGFYSGEEDMEFSSFSDGTELAVKTWQAASGAVEDGIMTTALLEKLYMEVRVKDTDNAGQKEPLTSSPKEGAVVGSVRETSEFHQTVAKDGIKEVPRVYLLGENRWEEPSRLLGRESHTYKGNTKNKTTRCPTCHGEGRLVCMECDGTGEPNVEPQFLEWVGEDTKCPYCGGVGYSICDVCDGMGRQQFEL